MERRGHQRTELLSDKSEALLALKKALQKQAQELGFAELKVAPPLLLQRNKEAFLSQLSQGAFGDMDWLAKRSDWRLDPKKLWPELRSVIMLAQPYDGNAFAWELLEQSTKGYISLYAQGRDYHIVVKKRLKALARFLMQSAKAYQPEVKVFVDTAPVMEKPLAEQAGLGWQGKHSNLVSRKLGSWFFLGAIFTTLELPFDKPETEHCGSCQACMDICPTKAIAAPFRLTIERCIAYLTIEHKGAIDPKLRPQLGNRIFGCDDCLAVCPWNKFAKGSHEAWTQSRASLKERSLAHFLSWTESDFRTALAASPLKRLGHARFLRNCLYAAGNSGDKKLIPAVQPWLESSEGFVCEAARWAMQVLSKGVLNP